MEPQKLTVTHSVWQSQGSIQCDSAQRVFESFPSVQPQAASAGDNNRGRLSSSEPALPREGS